MSTKIEAAYPIMVSVGIIPEYSKAGDDGKHIHQLNHHIRLLKTLIENPDTPLGSLPSSLFTTKYPALQTASHLPSLIVYCSGPPFI